MSELKSKCVLYRCCQSCSYCNYSRAAAKERYKTRSWFEANKLVKGVSCVGLSHFAPSVPSVPHVVTETGVGGRLQSFWQVWQRLGSNPRVVSLLSGKGHISAAFP